MAGGMRMPVTTAATYKGPPARRAKEISWLGKPNKWNPPKEKAPEPKPHAQPGLVGKGGKTPLKRQTGELHHRTTLTPVLDLPYFRGPVVTKETTTDGFMYEFGYGFMFRIMGL